jgi:hypothetical protein
MEHRLEDLEPSAPPRPVVLLRHEDGQSLPHVDWMIARNASGHGPLLTYRLPERLDTLATRGTTQAQRIQDHRPRYLRCDGPLGQGRGRIQRIATGSMRIKEIAPEGARLEIAWHTGPASGQRQALSLVHEGGSGFQVCCGAWKNG